MSRTSILAAIGLSLAITVAPRTLSAQDRTARERRERIALLEMALKAGTGAPAEHAWNIARTYAQLGNRQQALRWLGHALDMGFAPREAIGAEPAFAPYRHDERYQMIMEAAVHGSRSAATATVPRA